MMANTIQAHGIITGYSFEDVSQTLCVNTLIWIYGKEKILNFETPTFGENYNSFCNQLYLFTKEGNVNLDFLPETYIEVGLIIEDEVYKITTIEMDVLMYQ